MSDHSRSPLTIRLLGPLDVRVDGEPLPRLRSRKGEWLLALLTLRRGAPVERAWLAATLWPESSERHAYAGLRQSLTDLRRALGKEAHRLCSPTPRTLRLDLAGAEADVLTFDAAIARGAGEERFGRGAATGAREVGGGGRSPGAERSEVVRASLEEAIALYRGPLLEGCDEEWVFQERRAREEAYLTALERLAAGAMEKGETEAAVRFLRQAVAVDPLRETAQRSLMEALAAGGNYAATTLVYRDLRLLLHRELNAEPAPETTALFHGLRAEARRQAQSRPATHDLRPLRGHPPQAGTRPTAGTAASARGGRGAVVGEPPRRLPRPLTPLVGREKEVREIKDGLQSARLVTLTGTGGVGKTRLAIQVAEELAGEYLDGVWFVELAAFADPTLVPQTVATTLELRDLPQRPATETLQEFLRPRQALLVLDNCEHLVEACARLAEDLLCDCPELRILTTSRQSLGLTGERVYRVPSLSLPDPKAMVDGQWFMVDGDERSVGHQPSTINHQPSTLLQSEAVRLFVERAEAARPGFRPTGRDAAATVQVCRHLDGIPLALELAAARVPALSVEQIAARLEDRFHLLTSGSRTALPRQRTLRATMDWSYELLSEPERMLFRRLAVFAGGFTLEATEAVCGEEGLRPWAFGVREGPTNDRGPDPGSTAPDLRPKTQGLRPDDVLDLLTSLVEKSLVQYEEEGVEPRYRLLETVQQYGRERLVEAGEAAAVGRRHRDWFLALAERAAAKLAVPGEPIGATLLRHPSEEQGAWLDRLEAEQDNLRAALAWEEDAEEGLRLATALEPFWVPRGYWLEGLEGLERYLSRCPAGAADLRAEALAAAGRLAMCLGDLERAVASLEEALRLRRQLGDKRRIGITLAALGDAMARQRLLAEARLRMEEALAIFRESGEKMEMAAQLVGLAGVAHEQGDHATQLTRYQESLAIYKELGETGRTLEVRSGLGLLHLRRGEYAEARALFEANLAVQRQLGDRSGMAASLHSLRHLALYQADYAAARAFAEENLALVRESGSKPAMGAALWYAGLVARCQGDYEQARAWFAEDLALCRELGLEAGIASGLFNLGEVARARGEYAQAKALMSESLRIFRELPDKSSLVWCLEGLAKVASEEGRPERTARLLGAIEGLFGDSCASSRAPADQEDLERDVTAARRAVGDAAFAAAWAEGRAMSPEEAVAFALDEATDA